MGERAKKEKSMEKAIMKKEKIERIGTPSESGDEGVSMSLIQTRGSEEENKNAQFGGTGERTATVTQEYFLHLIASPVPK